MTIDTLDVSKHIATIEQLLKTEKLSPTMLATIQMLVLIIKLMTDKLGLNSRNSSQSPSTDLNRKKIAKKTSSRKAGGQKGHEGTRLEPIDDPDVTEYIPFDTSKNPSEHYTDSGVEKRQVVDIHISRIVTEYQAQVVTDAKGKRWVAPFPNGVTQPIQYGNSIKAQSVYYSLYQLIPYERLQSLFHEIYGIPISMGTLYNFNQEAFKQLSTFESIVKQVLINEDCIHVDETGVNIGGKRVWLHDASNSLWTLFQAHSKRGKEAMDDRGILPHFKGVLCHDHWKPYYKFDCLHALCNAHHLRELTYAYEQDNQQWAKDMYDFLIHANQVVNEAGGSLDPPTLALNLKRYRTILEQAQLECPIIQPPPNAKKRGRTKQTKSRNLLQRLVDFEDDVLRFMSDNNVPFTNNQGERDIRMTKVQQKISGCFRSQQGADNFCLVRSYLSTCRKHNVGEGDALKMLFDGVMPDFLERAAEKVGKKAE